MNKSLFHSGLTYYKMSNLDNRIANADQLLTQVSDDSTPLYY